MMMNRITMRMIAGGAIALLVAAMPAAAQPGTAATAGAQAAPFVFGPPLRNNAVFAYKYVERMTEVDRAEGQIVDSTERLVSYYISVRQSPSTERHGLIAVEANVDSMEIQQHGMGAPLVFNTQRIEMAQDRKLVSNRDIFPATVLVNRVVTFHITPYGQIVKVTSQSRDHALEDLDQAGLDPGMTERIRQVLTDEYLASVMLPWRNVVPLGQKVRYDKEMKIPFWTAFARLSFRDTATVTVVHEPDSASHLRFSAVLDRPRNKTDVISAFDEPIKLESAHADLGGDLKLDEDGVILSGWTIMKGTILSKRNGAAVKCTVTHEVYVQTMGTAPVVSQ